MSSTYDWLAQFAESAGVVYFFVFFLATLVYALWPRTACASMTRPACRCGRIER